MERRRSTRLSTDQQAHTPTGAVRKSDRKKTPSKKMDDIKEFLSPIRKRRPKNFDSKDESMSCSDNESENQDIDDHDSENIPILNHNLFDDKKDIDGRTVVGFQTPKKKDAMKKIAENTPKTPVTALKSMSLNSPRTPKTSRLQAIRITSQNQSTPSETRNKNKRQLQKKLAQATETESSADEHSDYEPQESSESSDEDSGDASSDGDAFEQPRSAKSTRKVPPIIISAKAAKITTVQPATRASARLRGKAKSHDDFIPDSDNYFIAASNKKSKTSDHTLDQLKSSRLQHDELYSLLSSINSSEEHQQKIAEMTHDLKLNFNRWMLEMSKGYNIIVYGCGSKQRLLHEFCETHLSDKPVVVVNGFFPSLTIRDILLAIKVQLLDINTNSRNDHEIVDLISSYLDSMPNGHVFLVINNIDGVMLRKTKDQHIISRLAKIKNLHLLASLDHINAPLMWDQTCTDNFNFVWYDCTTLLPYTRETAFENSVFFQNSGELDLAAMSNVFQSLTSNARGIYMILVKSQIANKKDSNYQGMTFKDLYQKSREGFLVSSDSTLRTQLTEFVDHNMAKIKRSPDGTELVSIPIKIDILSLFIQQQND